MKKLRLYWRNYLWQSLCATLAVFAVLVVLSLQHTLIIASVGATAFIVFMKPRNPFAAPRNVVGGHLIGFASGALVSLIPHPSPLLAATVYALAVGLCLFAMAATDTEHPPAAGTALSVAMSGVSWKVWMAVVTSAVLLALIQRVLRSHLRDL